MAKVKNKRKMREMHGGSGTPLYRVWSHMRDRCGNSRHPRYKDWGGRGVTICLEWYSSFIVFRDWAMANGYSDTLSIDRENNSLGYSPENCRWATRKQQQNNQRPRQQPSKSSRYIGVSFNNGVGMYACQVYGRPNGGKKHCGLFSTEESAAREYDRIVGLEIPERAYRNFPAVESPPIG